MLPPVMFSRFADGGCMRIAWRLRVEVVTLMATGTASCRSNTGTHSGTPNLGPAPPFRTVPDSYGAKYGRVLAKANKTLHAVVSETKATAGDGQGRGPLTITVGNILRDTLGLAKRQVSAL